MDIIPPILVIAGCVLDIMDILDPDSEDRMQRYTFTRIWQSIAAFFMWLKMLYFMRIFESTGYLIRMIIEVMFDMKEFLLVFIITTVAFGNSFYLIDLANLEEFDEDTGDSLMKFSNLFEGIYYSYLLALGDWDFEDWGPVASELWLTVFTVCTVFQMIVMFNLLIAIISETFATVQGNAENASY